MIRRGGMGSLGVWSLGSGSLVVWKPRSWTLKCSEKVLSSKLVLRNGPLYQIEQIESKQLAIYPYIARNMLYI